MKNPDVTSVVCSECGHSLLLSVNDGTQDKDTFKEITKLLSKGCKVYTISLEEARKSLMYCDESCSKPYKKK